MRVVVTGRGVVSGLGPDLAATWERLLAGGSSQGAATSQEARVDDAGLDAWLPGRRVRRMMDRRGLLAFAAARQALHESGLAGSGLGQGDRVGVTMATGHILADVRELSAAIAGGDDRRGSEWQVADILAVGRRVPPLAFVSRCNNMAASHVAIDAACRGPSSTFTGDCGGAHALGWASRWIRSGRADVMLAGGVEARIDPLHLALLDASSVEEREVPGEGAACLVLEALPHAVARGAPILAELVGYGCASEWDDDTGRLARAMDHAALLAMREMASEDVDVVLAARRGSRLHDEAMATLAAGRWRDVTITAPTSSFGQTCGAAQIIHSALATEMLSQQVVPWSIECVARMSGGGDLASGPSGPPTRPLHVAAVCGASSDGHQAAVVLWRRPDGAA